VLTTADRATRITNYGAFEKHFGGLWRESPLSYAVRHFYQNGGYTVNFNGVAVPGHEVFLRSRAGDPFRYGGRAYPGTLRVRRGQDERLEVDNIVGIEDYVAGVLFAEMPPNFPVEALKAQAVAARSYTMATRQVGAPYDVYSDTRSQVYLGVSHEDPATTAAVDATKAQVLMYDGKIATTFFSSTSGGVTESAAPRSFPARRATALSGSSATGAAPRRSTAGRARSRSPTWKRRGSARLRELDRAHRDAQRRARPLARVRGLRPLGRPHLQRPDFRRLWNVNATNESPRSSRASGSSRW
jgi:SpoIID/LytB domain protein